KLVRYLQRETPAKIVVSDPHLTAEQIEPCSSVEFTPCLDTALKDADFVLIATNHSLYSRERDKIVDAARLRGARVVDIWDCCGLGLVTFDRESLGAQSALKLCRAAA